jgi:hypothetical protein
MRDIKDILQNIETIYGSTNSLNILKDFERVIDELDVYVYDNWIDGELVEGPKDSRYWVTCTFMWPYKNMPDPVGGQRLLDYGCKVAYTQDSIVEVRKIKTADDIRPGTKKGKIDTKKVWYVEIKIPKKLMFDIDKGYRNLSKNKIEDDSLALDNSSTVAEPADQKLQQSMAGQ